MKSLSDSLGITDSGRWLLMVALLVAPGTGRTQQSETSEPSLAVTMQFIQEKMNGQGKLSYVVSGQNLNDQSLSRGTITSQNNDFSANSVSCRISFHAHFESNGKTTADETDVLDLRSIEKILVMPTAQAISQIEAENGHPANIATQTSPETFTMLVKGKKGHLDQFDFDDMDIAKRIATALNHAVELCGGGDNSPF